MKGKGGSNRKKEEKGIVNTSNISSTSSKKSSKEIKDSNLGEEFVNTSNLTKSLEKMDTSEVFADPTYDSTFKMLFGRDSNIELTKSFLNTILGFVGTSNEITELKIVGSSLIQEDVRSIESAIDVRCRTVSNQDISIEMQRRGEEYFLARTQDYMAKILSGQVTKTDGGKKYHLAMDKTYMLVISKAQLFLKENKLQGDTPVMYKKTVVPMVKELHEEIPGNKMNWIFIELPKFKNYINTGIVINEDSSLELQWLDFLLNCSSLEELPENRNNIIKRGYEIMKIAKWSKEDINAYELSKLKEAYSLKEEEKIKQDSEKYGFKKAEVQKYKDFQEFGLEKEKYIDKFKYLAEKDFSYIDNNIDETNTVIMGGMDIEMD